MTPSPSHQDSGSYELIVFDLRAPGARRRLLSERAAWGRNAAVELLDPDHAVMIVHAGGASRISEGRAV